MSSYLSPSPRFSRRRLVGSSLAGAALLPLAGTWRGSAEAAATPDAVAVTTVFDLAWPAGYIPVGDNSFFFFGRYSVAPGKALDFHQPCSGGNLVVSHVESGTYAVRATGPFQVLRGGTPEQPSARESVPADIEVQLHPGDGLVYRNLAGDDRTGFRNPGPDPVVVLEAIWTTDNDCVDGYADNMANVWDSYDYHPVVDPGRPVTFLLSRVSVAPDAVVSGEDLEAAVGVAPGDAIRWQRAYVEAGTLDVNRGVPAADAPGGLQTYAAGRGGMGGSAAVILDAPPGQPVPAATGTVLRNAGDGPLKLTVLTVALGAPEG